MQNSKLNIFGVNISTLGSAGTRAKVEDFLSGDKARFIVTPNPEILLGAAADEELWYILNQADLAIPDGVGLKLAARFSGVRLERITGVDLVQDALKLAAEKNKKVMVLNWRGGLSRAGEIESSVKKSYSGLAIKSLEIDRAGRLVALEEINGFAPDILLVTLGSPYQEKLIFHNLAKLPTVKLAIGIGGALDFMTGKIRRAPKLMRSLGIEWLWRLARQPRRIKRIFRAVIVFPLKFLNWRFVLPYFYRRNVVCILYKREAGGLKILLVERRDQPGHWQLPQGGIDGEGVETAGARELSEEVGTDKFKAMAVFNNLWRYEFGPDSGKYALHKHTGHKGQKQGLFIAEFRGADKEIKVNYWDHAGWKWVSSDKLVESVAPVRQEATRVFLEKFKKHSAIRQPAEAEHK